MSTAEEGASTTREEPTGDDPLSDAIDLYVEQWFAENPRVDIGRIRIPCIGDVDILPDCIEKALHKRLHTLMITNLMQTEVCICGVKMRLQQTLPPPSETVSESEPSAV